MSNPFVAFSETDSCTACPSNALTTIANDDITCTNNVCPTGMVYLDTFYGCVKKLPNGDESYSATGTAGTLRRAVSDWIAGGASKSTVVATYGPIEDWDVSEVTNMKYVFYNFGSFNADLSKWITGAVTTMYGSKCTLSLPLCDHGAFRCGVVLNIYDISRFVGSQVSHGCSCLFVV
jgi:surface protein